MEIRELRESDRSSLSRLIAEVQRELPEAMNFGSEPGLELIGETIGWKLEAVRSGALADLVAVEGGRVIADCEVLCLGPEGIVGIIVTRGHRGRGVGRSLLERCVARSRDLGVRTVSARVMASNVRAISFFSGLGFEKQAPGSGNCDTVLMSRTLP